MSTINKAANSHRPGTTTPTAGTRAVEPRETMRVLPRPLQLPLTLLTGKPLAGQKAVNLSPTHHLTAAFIDMAIGLAISGLALTAGTWWLCALPIGWAVTLHGMRNLRMMIYHQCAHRNMYRRRPLDAAIGRLTSSLLLIQNFARYSREHVSDHHAVHHMTLRDPTVQAFLISLDLHPGMTRRQMWRRTLGKLCSPRFHTAFAVGRLRSFFQQADRAEKAIAAVLYGTALALAVAAGAWQGLVIAWFVPLFPLFQISNTLRLCVKHTFPDPAVRSRRGKEHFAGLTNAIFLGEPVPERHGSASRRAWAWLRWAARMLLLHFPARFLVLTGDTVCHDFHHRYPNTRDWPNYIFARQRDLEAGHPGWPPYREVWGLGSAINLVFDSLSVAGREEFDVSRIRSVSRRELFAAFDD